MVSNKSNKHKNAYKNKIKAYYIFSVEHESTCKKALMLIRQENALLIIIRQNLHYFEHFLKLIYTLYIYIIYKKSN